MPLYEQRKAGMVRALFSGAGDSMSFVAPAPNGPAGTGLYRYTLEAAAGAGAGQRTLVVRLAPHLPLLSDSALERPPSGTIFYGTSVPCHSATSAAEP